VASTGLALAMGQYMPRVISVEIHLRFTDEMILKRTGTGLVLLRIAI
jgi:hypothetical protein